MSVAMVDWTAVLIYGIPAYIAALCSGAAVLVAALNRRELKTPSGEKIGEAVDRTLGLAGVTVAHTTALVRAANGSVKDSAKLEQMGEHATRTMAPEPAKDEGGG